MKIDVRQPVNFLKKKLQEVILEQRSYLFENRKTKFNSSSKNKNEIFMTYEGDDSLNVNGIFDKYLKIFFVKPKSKILFVSKLSRAKSKSKRKKFFSRNTTPHNAISLTLDDFFISEVSEKHTAKVLPLF